MGTSWAPNDLLSSLSLKAVEDKVHVPAETAVGVEQPHPDVGLEVPKVLVVLLIVSSESKWEAGREKLFLEVSVQVADCRPPRELQVIILVIFPVVEEAKVSQPEVQLSVVPYVNIG